MYPNLSSLGPCVFFSKVRKTLEAEAAAGNASKLLEAWRTEQSKAPTPRLGEKGWTCCTWTDISCRSYQIMQVCSILFVQMDPFRLQYVRISCVYNMRTHPHHAHSTSCPQMNTLHQIRLLHFGMSCQP